MGIPCGVHTMRKASWFPLPVIASLVLAAQAPARPQGTEPAAAVAAVLDDWQQSASQCDEERFFSHMAPGGVFIGIDERERWTRDEFRKAYHPLFEARQMWNFRVLKRNIQVAENGGSAWFDERLAAGGKIVFRGTGVLVNDGSGWQITQYALAFPVPRETFDQVLRLLMGANGTLESEPAQPSKAPTGTGK